MSDTGDERIEVWKGDITELAVDAIVNAANSSLLGGGGVDGAIHDVAGPGLREECRQLHGCAPGEAKMTGGYDLPAEYVIHTVGPVWRGGGSGEDETIASCYRNSLALAREHGLRSIALPAISTGVYGFPSDRAARIAVREARHYLADDKQMERIVFVCFDDATVRAYEAALREPGA